MDLSCLQGSRSQAFSFLGVSCQDCGKPHPGQIPSIWKRFSVSRLKGSLKGHLVQTHQ